MPEVCFARTFTSPAQLIGDDPEVLNLFRAVNGLQPNDGIAPGSVYTLDISDPQARSIVREFNVLRREQCESLARSAEATGDETHRLAAFFQQILSFDMAKANSMVGAGATAAHARLTGFQRTLLHYQETLLDLRKLEKASHPGIGARRTQAESRAHAAYRKLQTAYRNELDRLSPEVFRNRNRGDALSNAERAITLARRSPQGRPDPRLNVADTFQARRLATFSKVLNHVGHAALALDGGLRGIGVYKTHQEGGKWMREASIQATGFGFGGVAGLAVGKTVVTGGTALAAGFAASGPVGWVILGVVVGVGLLAGFGAGYYADQIGQSFASTTWDRSWGHAWDQFWVWAW